MVFIVSNCHTQNCVLHCQTPQSLTMPYNKGGNHWILFRCLFPGFYTDDLGEAFVYSIDYLNDDEDYDTKTTRIAFAKLMGVYFGVLSQNQAYAGPEDIHLTFHEDSASYIQKKKSYFSLVSNAHMQKGVVVQRDNYNCGVITCLSNTLFSNKSDDFIREEEISEEKCIYWRQVFCSFLKKMTLEFKYMEESIEPLTKHAKMPVKESNDDPMLVDDQLPVPVSNEINQEENTEINQEENNEINQEENKLTPLPTSNSSLKAAFPESSTAATRPIPKALDNAFENSKKFTPMKQVKSKYTPTKKAKLDEESTKKFLHGTSTKKDRRMKLNALSMEGTKSSGAFGNSKEWSLNGPQGMSASIVDQLVGVLASRLYCEREDAEEFFKTEMKKYETFYVSDCEYYDPSDQYNRSNPDTITDNKEHTIMTVAIVEVADFGSWTYKKRNVIENNQIKTITSKAGYKVTEKVLIIHHIATKSLFENHGYASHLLKWIAESFHGTCSFVYKVMPPEAVYKDIERGGVPSTMDDQLKAKSFFTNRRFESDPKDQNFNLSIVDCKKRSQESITSEINKLYRVSTTNLMNIQQEYLYGTSKFGKLDRLFVSKLSYCRKTEEKNEDGGYIDDFFNKMKQLRYRHKKKEVVADDDSSSGDDSDSTLDESDTDESTKEIKNKGDGEGEAKDIKNKGDGEGKAEEIKNKGDGEGKANSNDESDTVMKDTKESTKDTEGKENCEIEKEAEQNRNTEGDEIEKTTLKKKGIGKKLPTNPYLKKEEASSAERVQKKPVSIRKKSKTPTNPYKKAEIDMAFYGYNPHFGWMHFDEDLLTTIDRTIIELVRENKNAVVKIPGGYRERDTRKEVSLENISYLPRIKYAFQLASRTKKEMGTCQWMAAMMLINEVNEFEAQKMMIFMKDSPERVNWKPMFVGKDSLTYTLNMVTNFMLRKVKTGKPIKNWIPFLMKANEGQFVCILTDNNYAEKHVIGIDCGRDPKLIWDASEKQALELTEKNLDRCTGIGNFCLKISTIGEIVPKLMKRGKKRAYTGSSNFY